MVFVVCMHIFVRCVLYMWCGFVVCMHSVCVWYSLQHIYLISEYLTYHHNQKCGTICLLRFSKPLIHLTRACVGVTCHRFLTLTAFWTGSAALAQNSATEKTPSEDGEVNFSKDTENQGADVNK